MGYPDEPQPDRSETYEVTRSEEQLNVTFDRVPYQRVRLVKYVTTHEVTRTFQIRREELRIEAQDVQGADPVEPWAARLTAEEPLELTLSEEQLVVEARVVPRERVRVWVEDVPMGDQTVSAALRKEQVEVVGPTEAGQTDVMADGMERPAY